MKKTIIITMFLLPTFSAFAQKENASIAKGNEAYRKQDYEKAETAYEKALSLSPGNTVATFNLANAQFRNKKTDEAIKNFEKTADNSHDSSAKATALYNKGVVLTREKKTSESIEAYKDALRLNPADTLARENLLRALREQQQNNKKDQKDQKEKKQPNKLNKQQVMQLLQALQEQEKLLQQKLQKSKVPAPGQPEKDW